MFISYFNLAIRLLIRNPLFSLINAIGLAVGFAVFFILWPFSTSELRSDQFRKDHESIVRVCTNLKWKDVENGNWEEVTGLAPTYTCFELVKDAKEIEDYTRYLDQPLFDEDNAGIGSDVIIATGHDFRVFILLFVSGTILTALYPAWIVLRFSCLQLLEKRKVTHKLLITPLLTTFQYSTAIVLIAWVFVVCVQLNLILKKDIGLGRDNVISIDKPIIGGGTSQNIEFKTFADLVRKIPGVEDVAISSWVSGDMTVSQTFFRSIDADNFLIVDCHGVDEHFIPLYNIKLLAGRNFIKDEPDDAIILSKLFSERLGFTSPHDAIEQWIQIRTDSAQWKTVQIIGVTADYRVTPFFTSKNYTLNRTDRGQALAYLNNILPSIKPHRISIKINTPGTAESIAKIGNVFHQTFPGNIFNWYFLNDNVNRHYTQQKIARNQILLFALLAIGVSCLGLLGMISNKAIEKTKEIGLRKILGADLTHIAYILLSTTGKQIIISIIIGVPVAWKLSQEYLHNFTEQISLRWWYFALPVTILLAIMLTSVSVTIIKVLRTNAIESLRNE